MVTMTTPPWSRPLTRADLDAMTDDGHRHELIDATLVVTPAPRFRHQDVVGHLHLIPTAECPEEMRVVLAPSSVTLADDTVMQPDLLVTTYADITDRDLPTVPLLAIEVADVSGDDTFTTEVPFALAVVPARLRRAPSAP